MREAVRAHEKHQIKGSDSSELFKLFSKHDQVAYCRSQKQTESHGLRQDQTMKGELTFNSRNQNPQPSLQLTLLECETELEPVLLSCDTTSMCVPNDY